ncbi:MAG TPA: GNAT family N-acetyltransferase [Candidatus Limnocylindria bacterium]
MTTLARAVNDNFVVAQRLWTQSDPILARRYGLANATRRGVVCFSAASFPEPFGDLAIGFGVRQPPTRVALDAVLAYYAQLKLAPRVALLGRLAPQSVARPLRRAGLREAEPQHHVFVRRGRALSRQTVEPDVAIESVAADDAAPLAFLAQSGFGGGGPIAEYFTRTRIAMLRAHPRTVMAVRATRGGDPAGSGIVIVSSGAASLWSGSVLPAHRGHGLQRALIAERVRIAVERGARACFSLAEPDGRSARNLRAMGFHDVGPLRVFTT